MARKRMTMPKRKEDIHKIVEEVEESHHHDHGHEHHHHHHHGGDLEDAIAAMELLVDSLSAKVRGLEGSLKRQGTALATLYRVVAYLVEAVSTENKEEKERALRKALEALESLKA